MPLQAYTADELMNRARSGDIEAFAEVFETHRSLMHRVAYRLAGPNDCDDVLMETYLKAWRALPQFKGHAALSTWLCRIAHNCALDFRRQERRRDSHRVSSEAPDTAPLVERVADSHATAPDQAALHRDLGATLERAMQTLSECQRLTVLLREVDGLSYREVARATGVSIGTVMSRLFNARRRLRRALEMEGVESP